MGGEQQNLVFIGTDGGSDQVLGIDQTLVKFEDCLVSGGSDPCDSLAMSRPQPGDVAREGVPQFYLHLVEAGRLMTGRPPPAQLELAVVSPGVDLPAGRQGH